ETYVGGKKTECREYCRFARHYRHRNREFARYRIGMSAACPAEGNQREVPRVEAALYRGCANAFGNSARRQRMNGQARRFNRQAERPCNCLRYRLLCEFLV